MQYMGGKAKQARHIADAILARLIDGATYHEPFLGGGSVAAAVARTGRVQSMSLSDMHPDLILLWRDVLTGWVPPTEVTEDQYESLRHASPSGLRGFVGFGCSFAGKFFGGFARDGSGRNYAANASNSLMRKVEPLRRLGEGVRIACQSYEQVTPSLGDVLYLDPPYANTTKYAGVDDFDHAEFWTWAEGCAQRGVHVLVNEYSAPTGWVSLASVERGAADLTTSQRTEHLYVWGGN